MKISVLSVAIVFFTISVFGQAPSLDEWLNTPYVSSLYSAPTQSTVLFQVNEKGLRNVYKASAPQFEVKKITNFTKDDGLELTSIKLSPDGKWAVFVRGGEHSGNSAVRPGNPASLVEKQKILIHAVQLSTGSEIIIGEGDYPIFHPNSQSITFLKGGQAWTYDFGSKKSSQLFHVSGSVGGMQWSPDGKKLLFSTSRTSHSFIGIFSEGKERIQWLAPAFHRDRFPKWSPDGKSVAFVRTNASGGELKPILERRHEPWTICVVSVESGAVQEIWNAPKTLQGSVPSWQGTFNLEWNLPNKISFLSYQDGWPHLYAIAPDGSQFTQLTKGKYTVDQIEYSADKRFILFAANTGSTKEDLDRKHIGKIDLQNNKLEWLTDGGGIEAYPQFLDNGRSITFLSSQLDRPYLPAVVDLEKPKNWKVIGSDLLKGFDFSHHVKPEQINFPSEDGMTVYGQIYKPKNVSEKSPALVYIHGGPRRQMFMGWHFLDYYFTDYIVNQYLVSKGFVVLVVNYRMGTGYGFDFQSPDRVGTQGAEEYLDILASGKWLQKQNFVDPNRIGVYGGSYGGYLTAFALGKNSDIFVAGVDIHGVHTRSMKQNPDQFAPDFEKASQIAWESSPSRFVDTWRSPVLLIHADDDQNVAFSQSIDLYNRLRDRGIETESLVIPDDTHHWMVYENLLQVKQATADYLVQKVKNKNK